MRLTVDRNLCMSTALCTGLAPDVLDMDEAGLLVVRAEHIGDDVREGVEEAVRMCPVQALSLTEE